MLTTILFYVYAAVLVGAALGVVLVRNPVHAALFLVLAFFNSAALWLLLEAEFLAITLVLVYVGAVMVLFLFVVMMLDINVDSLRQGFWRHFPLAGTVGALVALEMAFILMGGFRISEEPKLVASAVAASNTRDLGKLLYSGYVFPVQIAAVILLVAIIAAIALTLRGRKDSKHIGAGAQIRVQPGDRLRLIKVAATQPAPPPEAAPSESKT